MLRSGVTTPRYARPSTSPSTALASAAFAGCQGTLRHQQVLQRGGIGRLKQDRHIGARAEIRIGPGHRDALHDRRSQSRASPESDRHSCCW